MAEQDERPLTPLKSFRRRKDHQFALDPHSPLTQQRAVFKGMNYFPENPALRLEVDVQVFEAGDVRAGATHQAASAAGEGATAALMIRDYLRKVA